MNGVKVEGAREAQASIEVRSADGNRSTQASIGEGCETG